MYWYNMRDEHNKVWDTTYVSRGTLLKSAISSDKVASSLSRPSTSIPTTSSSTLNTRFLSMIWFVSVKFSLLGSMLQALDSSRERFAVMKLMEDVEREGMVELSYCSSWVPSADIEGPRVRIGGWRLADVVEETGPEKKMCNEGDTVGSDFAQIK